jgi:hypothetical protein
VSVFIGSCEKHEKFISEVLFFLNLLQLITCTIRNLQCELNSYVNLIAISPQGKFINKKEENENGESKAETNS